MITAGRPKGLPVSRAPGMDKAVEIILNIIALYAA